MTAASAALAAEFDDERGPARGRSLVDAARDVGAGWVVVSVGAELKGLGATARAAEEAGVGLIVRLDDKRGLDGLAEAMPAHAARTAGENRDRVVVVVAAELVGRHLRREAPWAPSAVDVDRIGGAARIFRRVAPNYVRAMCRADDVVAPAAMFSEARVAALAAKLRLRGSRLWLTGVAPKDAERAALGPAFGIVVNR